MPKAAMSRLDERIAVGISTVEPDWRRENAKGWMPGAKLVRTLRDWRGAGNVVARKFAVMRHRFWSAVTGADIPINSTIAGGFMIPHPCGIVIHPDVTIGPNCLIFQNVTLGMHDGGVPRLGGHVLVGAGAVILGSVTIGDHAVVGANAVVLQDVPAGATAVGNPAKILQ
jgi:serine O-acetyltransferase